MCEFSAFCWSKDNTEYDIGHIIDLTDKNFFPVHVALDVEYVNNVDISNSSLTTGGAAFNSQKKKKGHK